MRAGIGHLFLGIAIEFCLHRIAGVAGIDKRRIGHDASHPLFDHLIGRDGFTQFGWIIFCQSVQLSGIGFLEFGRLLF